MVALTTFLLFDIAAKASSRESSTLAMPIFGSLVANGYGAARAFEPVRALYSDDLPALGSPTSPKRSIQRPDATPDRNDYITSGAPQATPLEQRLWTGELLLSA